MAAKGKTILKYSAGQMVEYTLYELVNKHEKILWEKVEPFDFSRPPEDPKKIAVSLLQTMVDRGGVGLSANQVGLPYRVFVMGGGEHWFACFNPEIVESYGENVDHDEGCLTYPGLFLKIKRANRVKLKYQDHNGTVNEKAFDGFTARVVQHEMEHLNGSSFTKQVSSIVLRRAQEKVKTNLRRAKNNK